jgi:hypothetical protein
MQEPRVKFRLSVLIPKESNRSDSYRTSSSVREKLDTTYEDKTSLNSSFTFLWLRDLAVFLFFFNETIITQNQFVASCFLQIEKN